VFVAAGLLSPHPQLFPDLDQFLNGTSTGNAIIHHAAARVGSVIGLTRGGKAEARQAAANLPDFVGGHDFAGWFVWAHIGATSHDGENRTTFAIYSPALICLKQMTRWHQLFLASSRLTWAREQRRMITTFVHWVLLLGTIGIVIYCITMFIRYRGSGSWTLISGKVESYDKPTYDDGSRSVCYTMVRYSYSVDDHQYFGGWMTPFLRNVPALNEFLAAELPIGKIVDVRYNPKQANRSVLADPPLLPPSEIVMKTDFTG
jgi:Protein of unknown function (DUF3592)